MNIERAKPDDAYAIAKLHKEMIPTGFISSLNIEFLHVIYEHIIKNEFVLIVKDKGHLTGFISLSLDTKKMYRKFIFKNLFRSIMQLSSILFRKSTIRRAMETLIIPFRRSRNAINYPIIKPELLSIAVSNNNREKGIATKLLNGLEKYLASCSQLRYRVVAGQDLKEANRFYISKGFELIGNVELHRNNISNLYVKTISL